MLSDSILFSNGRFELQAIRYQDMIAVLTLGIQSIDSRLWSLDTKLAGMKSKTVELKLT